jgi:hypothetical protein
MGIIMPDMGMTVNASSTADRLPTYATGERLGLRHSVSRQWNPSLFANEYGRRVTHLSFVRETGTAF